MARYRIAKDGHRFLTHGYAILDKQTEDDVRFSTYQVNTGGERVFDRARFEDGDRVSEETFFALLLDGDLYNDSRPNGIDAAAIPNRVLAYMDSVVRQYHLDQIMIEGRVYLFDILELLRPQFKDIVDALSTASWLCIYRHWKIRTERLNPAAATKSYPAFGQKTPDYPFGYGRCQCGCNKTTDMKRTGATSDWVWKSYIDGHEHNQNNAAKDSLTTRPSTRPKEWDDIQRRCEAVSRGRAVEVGSRESTILNADFTVAYLEAENSFRVEFTRNGYFEGAYRVIERCITAKAERLDGVFKAAGVGYVDFRETLLYWLLEKQFDVYRDDLLRAVDRQIQWLNEERPGENAMGDATIESRVRALTGFLRRVEHVAKEVHAGLLSPDAIALLRDIGLWTKESLNPSGTDER